MDDVGDDWPDQFIAEPIIADDGSIIFHSNPALPPPAMISSVYNQVVMASGAMFVHSSSLNSASPASAYYTNNMLGETSQQLGYYTNMLAGTLGQRDREELLLLPPYPGSPLSLMRRRRRDEEEVVRSIQRRRTIHFSSHSLQVDSGLATLLAEESQQAGYQTHMLAGTSESLPAGALPTSTSSQPVNVGASGSGTLPSSYEARIITNITSVAGPCALVIHRPRNVARIVGEIPLARVRESMIPFNAHNIFGTLIPVLDQAQGNRRIGVIRYSVLRAYMNLWYALASDPLSLLVLITAEEDEDGLVHGSGGPGGGPGRTMTCSLHLSQPAPSPPTGSGGGGGGSGSSTTSTNFTNSAMTSSFQLLTWLNHHLDKILPYVNESNTRDAVEDSITWPVRKVIPILPGDYSKAEVIQVMNLCTSRWSFVEKADVNKLWSHLDFLHTWSRHLLSQQKGAGSVPVSN